MNLDNTPSPTQKHLHPTQKHLPPKSKPWSSAFHTEAANTLQELLQSGRWETNPMTQNYTKKGLEERIESERALAIEKAEIAQRNAKFLSPEFHKATAEFLQAHLDNDSYKTHPELKNYTKMKLEARIETERDLAETSKETPPPHPSELLDGLHPGGVHPLQDGQNDDLNEVFEALKS